MKPTHYVAFILATLIFLSSCKKRITTEDFNEKELIQSARNYFTTNVQFSPLSAEAGARAREVKFPDWQSAFIQSSDNGDLVVVPVFYKNHLAIRTTLTGERMMNLNAMTKLIIYKDTTGFHTLLATYLPDSNDNPVSAFSGIILVESWQGLPLKKFKVSSGISLTELPSTAPQNNPARTNLSENPKPASVIETCITIYGYNYSGDDRDNGTYWEESGGCSYSYLPDDPGVGISPTSLASASGSSSGGSVTTVVIHPPTNVIANVADYLKCFSNYGGSDHNYQVTLCIDQPTPGSRTPWALSPSGAATSSAGSNPVDVGHTYLVLTENFGTYSIARNIGFYPQQSVFPWTPAAQGQLNNDDGHTYNISLTITVDNGQFFNILSYISQGNNAGYMYDLNTNNCTTFALHALQAGNISLPATVGTWTGGGYGYDPGDMGEDVRNMTLSSNMTRSTDYSSLPNKYTCN